jgi:hypothetical protein
MQRKKPPRLRRKSGFEEVSVEAGYRPFVAPVDVAPLGAAGLAAGVNALFTRLKNCANSPLAALGAGAAGGVPLAVDWVDARTAALAAGAGSAALFGGAAAAPCGGAAAQDGQPIP